MQAARIVHGLPIPAALLLVRAAVVAVAGDRIPALPAPAEMQLLMVVVVAVAALVPPQVLAAAPAVTD